MVAIPIFKRTFRFLLSAIIVIAFLLVVFIVFVYSGNDGLNNPPEFVSLPTAKIKPVHLDSGKLAISAYMLTGDNRDKETWRITLRRMRAMGAQVVALGQVAWRDMEPEPGVYKWGYIETVINLLDEEKLDMEVSADIAMFINPGLDSVPRLPKHLEGLAFDDPKIIESLSRLYESFLKHFGHRVTYLFQHFENCMPYFHEHPDDLPRVQKLLHESFTRAKQQKPGLKTGVCIQSYDAPHYPAKWISAFNEATDVVPIISFNPTDFEDHNNFETTRKEFAVCLRAVGKKKIALHETSYASQPNADSNPDAQARWVREIFKLLHNYHDDIELITWYEYADLEPEAASLIGEYIAKLAGNPSFAKYFTASMGSSGLLTSDGRAKPSAFAWCEEAAKYYEYRKTGAKINLTDKYQLRK